MYLGAIKMADKKFRGYCHEFGSFVYGRLLRRDYYNTGYYECFIEGTDEDYGDYLPDVDPDTVAQMVGHDKDGAEIYEGDKLVDNLGREHIATIQDTFELIAELKLKEDACKLYFDSQVRNDD